MVDKVIGAVSAILAAGALVAAGRATVRLTQLQIEEQDRLLRAAYEGTLREPVPLEIMNAVICLGDDEDRKAA
jgi:hypothetical protein